MKINHVAIAVENVEDAAKAYQDALDVKDIEFETVESEGVKVAILHLENANIELMQPTNDSSPIKKFLEKRGSGLHHIALETPNIEGEVSRMEGCGIRDKLSERISITFNEDEICIEQSTRADKEKSVLVDA